MQASSIERMPLVNRLKEFLQTRKLSVYQFCREIGMSETRAYKLVNNPKELPSGAVLSRICDRFDVTPNDILEKVPANEKASESPSEEN